GGTGGLTGGKEDPDHRCYRPRFGEGVRGPPGEGREVMAAINSRYARALADVAVERKLDADQMVGEMNLLAQALVVSTELRIALETPSVPTAQKLKVLDAVVA